MKKYFIGILAILAFVFCMVSTGFAFASTSQSEAQPQEQAAYLAVQEKIDALPTGEKISQMGNSDKRKAYADMLAAKDAYDRLSEEEQERISVLALRSVSEYFNVYPLPTGEVSYGFLMDQTLVTSENLSGNGWEYDPDTQTLTIGDENEISVLFDTIPKNTDNCWQVYYKDIDGAEHELFYTAVLQPVVLERYVDTNTCAFSPDRPSKLKIVVKRTVVFGNTRWSNRSSQYSLECDKYFEMGGILWDGDLEITGNGLLSLHATTDAIYVDGTANIHDIKLETYAYNEAICVYGDLNVTNVTIKAKSNSLGSVHYDLRLKTQGGEKRVITDSGDTIWVSGGISGGGSFNIKDSTVTVDATWNRVYTTEYIPSCSGQNVYALFASYINVTNSVVNATAHIEEGWQSCRADYGPGSVLSGIGGELNLYDDAFVNANSYVGEYFSSNAHLLSYTTLCGLRGKSKGRGNAVLVASTEPFLGYARQAIKDFCFNSVTQSWAVGYIQTEGSVQYTFATPSSERGNIERSLIVEYRKDDTVYLRDQDGKKQASWNMDFSNCVDLESNVINEADFSSQVESRPCNVRVVSGDFTVIAEPNGEADRFYETLGGSLTVQLKEGENYGDVHVFTAPSSSVTIEGKAVIENLTVKPRVSIDHKTYYVETGSLTIGVATVKNCVIDKTYNDKVSFKSGNVKVDIDDIEYYRQYFKSYYNTIIYDFSDVQGTVDVANDGMSVNNGYSVEGSQLIDGKYYFYVKKTEALEEFVNNVYVEPSTGYNYYMLPEKVSKEDDVTTYTFKRADETFYFTPEPIKEYAYVSVGDKDVTFDAGYVQAYVFNMAINSGLRTELRDSKTQTLPEGYFAKWFYVDEKTSEVTQLVVGQSLLYTVNEVVLDDEFRTYTCEVYRKGAGTASDTSLGSYSIKPRIMIMSVSPRTGYVKKGDTITLKLEVDPNDRDDWREFLFVAWQAKKDAESEWVSISDTTKSNPTYALKFENDEMISWEYRAMLYQLIKPIGKQAIPDYYSESVSFSERGAPAIGEISSSVEDFSGEEISLRASITNGVVPAVECYWEYSRDNGQTWKDASEYKAFKPGSLTISSGGSGTILSAMLVICLRNEMDGWQVRGVLKDNQDGSYLYTNVCEISVTPLPEIQTGPSNVRVFSDDSSVVLPCKMTGSVENVTYTQQWQKKVDGGNWVNIENATGDTYALGDLTSAPKATYYRC